MNVQAISEYIGIKPTTIQVAKDGKWEKAWILRCRDNFPSENEIITYLSSESFNDLEFELLFEQNDSAYIFGIDYASHLKVSDPKEFLSEIFRLSKSYKNFSSYISSLNQSFFKENYLFSEEPDLIRIGIVNHWFSVGPVQIWERGEAKIIQESQLESILQKRQEIFHTSLNYQGLSFVMNMKSKNPGTCHWIKAPCSRKNNGMWSLNIDEIQRYLREWGGLQSKE